MALAICGLEQSINHYEPTDSYINDDYKHYELEKDRTSKFKKVKTKRTPKRVKWHDYHGVCYGKILPNSTENIFNYVEEGKSKKVLNELTHKEITLKIREGRKAESELKQELFDLQGKLQEKHIKLKRSWFQRMINKHFSSKYGNKLLLH